MKMMVSLALKLTLGEMMKQLPPVVTACGDSKSENDEWGHYNSVRQLGMEVLLVHPF